MLPNHTWVCNFPRLFSVALITLDQKPQEGEGFLQLIFPGQNSPPREAREELKEKLKVGCRNHGGRLLRASAVTLLIQPSPAGIRMARAQWDGPTQTWSEAIDRGNSFLKGPPSQCISYFSAAVLKSHGQSNLQKEGFIWAQVS